jgi:signal transduction histidine kinase
MTQVLSSWFSNAGFMPHGHCWLWTPSLLWLQVTTNLFIGLAYVAISATLAYLVYRIRDLPFKRIYLAFGVFIITCGFTHFMDVWVIWHPNYWVDGGIRFVTALASVFTAMLLPPLVPQAVTLARGAKAAHDRGMHLESAVHDLERLYERATELDRLKTRFFANVSHELRTPLALVLGPLEQLERGELSAEVRREVEVASRNARLLLNQVNDLLDVAELEAGEVRLREVRVDLAALVRTAVANFDGLARERRVRLTVDARAPLWTVVDAERIRRAVLNVLSNAFKFTPPGGRVGVTVRRAGDGARIEVTDTGPGIPADQRGRVFERFHRLDSPQGEPGRSSTVSRRFGSTGLGLPIVKDFVELHGGSVDIADGPEGGVVFGIALPIRSDDSATGADEDVPVDVSALVGPEDDDDDVAEGLQPDATLSGRPVALVVEDNRDLRSFLRRVLEPDYQVFVASDGAQGARRAIDVAPDVIVSDLMMPFASGETLVQRVREERSLDGVPIVLLTARADESLRVDLLRSGAQDWLQKPFLPQELRARVDNLVQVRRVRRILQDQLDTRSTDLEALVRQLGVARELAARSSELKSVFLRAVSHELRSPLHAFGLQLAVLERGGTEVREQLVPRMRQSLDRMRSLVESLLQKARLQGQELEFTVSSFDPGAMVLEVVRAAQAAAREKGLELVAEVDENLPQLRSDPDLVRLITSNLVGNAVKFTVEGRVRVGMTLREGRHELIVSDTGPGLSQAMQEVLFEPFVSGRESERAHQPGLGLGLSLARDLARGLGGEISVASGAEGTAVTVLLPSIDWDVVA